MEMANGLLQFVVLKCKRIHFDYYAGAGVVAESKPEDELAETSAKFQTMLKALRLSDNSLNEDRGKKMLIGYTEWPKELVDRYREEGCWLGETFGSMLKERAEKHGDQIAVVSSNTHITYSELDKKVDRLASGF